MLFLLSSVLLLKLLIIFIYKRKYGFINSGTIILLITLLYSQSPFLDHILFGHQTLSYESFKDLNIISYNYLYITLIYFLFFLGFSFSTIFSKNNNKSVIAHKYIYENRNWYNYLLIIILAILVFYVSSNLYGLARLEKINFLSSNKYLVLLLNFSYFGIVFQFFKHKYSKFNLSFFIFLALTLTYGFVEGGREIFIIILLIYFFSKNNQNISIKDIFIFSSVFIIVVLWKIISVFIFELGDILRFMDKVNFDFTFSLTRLDPLPSILMINEYMIGNSLFEQFYFSYFYNPVLQFLRIFDMVDYETLAERTTFIFSPLKYYSGGGLAFSGILESLVNFWLFGPLFLGIFIGYLCNIINKYKYDDTFLYSTLSILFCIVFFKLIRTEMAVVFKLYIIPMIISYFIFYKLTYKSKAKIL